MTGSVSLGMAVMSRVVWTTNELHPLRSHVVKYLDRIPGYCTDWLSAQIVQSQTFSLILHIPYGHCPSATARGQNVWCSFVPIKAVEIVSSGHSVTHAEWTSDVVEIGNKQLIQPQLPKRKLDALHTSPLAPTVASSSERNALNWSALMAPLCFEVRDLMASLNRR